MNPRLEALLAVDPRDLTDAERAALDAALAVDEDAAYTALGVGLDAELAEEIGDPLTCAVPKQPDAQRAWFAIAAAVVLLAAAVALVVWWRSASDEPRRRAADVAPAPEPVRELERVAPAPELARDGLRPLPIGAARPRPRRPAPKSAKNAKLHTERARHYEQAGDHESAAFAYVDAFRAMPTEPALTYAAAVEMERAGRCADAAAWFRLAVSLDPDADYVDDAESRAAALGRSCAEQAPVISTSGADADEARARYAHARELYAAGDFRGAARQFAGAYEGLPVPELAYNVAAAYHRSDDCANTVAWFRHYLGVAPAAPDREQVEATIAAYEQAGCDQPVTHPPRVREVAAPKRRLEPPKRVAFPDEDGRSTVSAERLATEALEAAKQGSYRRAYELCGQALELVPGNARARMVCVIAACKLKDDERAREHYEQLSSTARRAVLELCRASGVELPEPAAEAPGDPELPERLGRADITATIGAVRGRIGECGRAGGYSGTMKVKMTIDPDGRVSSASAEPAGDAAECVEQIVRALQFPKAQRPMSVVYPVVFR